MCALLELSSEKNKMKGETGRIEELGFFLPARGHLMEVMFGNLLLGKKRGKVLPCKYGLIFDLNPPDTTVGKGKKTDDDQYISLTYIISIQVKLELLLTL